MCGAEEKKRILLSVTHYSTLLYVLLWNNSCRSRPQGGETIRPSDLDELLHVGRGLPLTRGPSVGEASGNRQAEDLGQVRGHEEMHGIPNTVSVVTPGRVEAELHSR